MKPVKIWLYSLLYILVQHAFSIGMMILLFIIAHMHPDIVTAFASAWVASYGVLWEFFKRHKRFMTKKESGRIIKQVGSVYTLLILSGIPFIEKFTGDKDIFSSPVLLIIAALIILLLMWGVLFLSMYLARRMLIRQLIKKKMLQEIPE